MLKFFGKIRRKLIDDGNLKRYLFYAIGEILLVMIGILLALQVNNWSERKKMRIEEREYLQRLYTDLEIDSSYLSQRIKKSNQEIENYYTFIHEAYKYQNSVEDFKELIGFTEFSSTHLTIQNSTFLEMINSGKLDLISNDSLKVVINDLYRSFDAVGKHIKEFNEFSVSLLTEWSKTINDSKYRGIVSFVFDEPFMYKTDDWKWINNPNSKKFRFAEETVAIYTAKHKIFLIHFKQLLEELTSVSNIIKDELRT